MIHETETETTHVVTFTEDEATLLGGWLSAAYELTMSAVEHNPHDVQPELQDLIGQLANYLNGVD